MMVRRSASHLGPAVSLNSFVLGFLIGCVAFYAFHCIDPVDMCIDCGSDRAALPYLPPSLTASVQPRPSTATSATLTSSSATAAAANTSREASAAATAESGCPDAPLRLAVLILSTPSGSLRRNAIRGTWMHDTPPNRVKMTLRFLVGTKDLSEEQLTSLSSESAMFDDLLFLPDHKEAYSNLTAKVLTGLLWAESNLEFDYLLKADDDSYVRIPLLDSALRRLHCPAHLYWGYFIGHAFPETAGRWAERHWTMCPHYLPYAMGGGYVLSRHIVQIIRRFNKKLKLYSNEDVSMGSWLAPFHVSYQHDLRFNTEATSHGCNNHYIISHKEKVRSMYEKYVNLKKNGTFCVEEKELRPAYNYNWTAASPLNCCDRVKGLPVPP